MKTKYLPRSRERADYPKRAAFLGALFAFGLFAFSLLDGAILSAVSPLWRAETGLGRALEAWRGDSLSAENARLRERVASLELMLERSPAEALEGPALKASAPASAGILAAVLTRPPQSPYDFVVIGAGERDGLALGAAAALPEGPLLGTVAYLFRGTAKVKLFSTAGERTNAVLERHEVPVVLEGRGGGGFRLEVARETEVEPGDRILAPGLERLLAVVESVRVAPTDSYKEVFASGPANLFELQFVTILP